MTLLRPILHVLVAIALIAAGVMSSVAIPAHAHAGLDAVSVQAVDVHEHRHDADAGETHAACCSACGHHCAPLSAPASIAHPSARAGRVDIGKLDAGHPDALSEALPRPPRSFV